MFQNLKIFSAFSLLLLPQFVFAAGRNQTPFWVWVCFYIGLVLLLGGFIMFMVGVIKSTKKRTKDESTESIKKRKDLASKLILLGLGMFFVGFICLSIGTTMMGD